jgi:hypothetical protein
MKKKIKTVMIGNRPGVVLKLAWVDHDPKYPADVQYELYHTRADQRDNRPDLKPIRVALVAIR